MNYEKLGLKCGIEIHQQLNTKKLFCECETGMKDSSQGVIKRELRAVAGELGEIDRAALQEVLKGKRFHYHVFPKESCLVEEDEEPPHEINKQALEIALTVALMLNCEIPDEIHMMRKQVVDGSNTTGFQRTAVIGMNGVLKTKSGNIRISNLCLEEEAAQILEKGADFVSYGLNRLGIPLIEIGTAPDIKTPEQAKEVAKAIGMLLRSTERVKRGIGTIRQDINISIKDGARIEIKGAQELKLIPKLVENEVKRQMNLIEIKNRLKNIGFKPLKQKPLDVTHIFKNSEFGPAKKGKTYALLVPDFAGFLKTKLTPTKTLGKEIAGYVKAKTGLKGIIHSDEEVGKYKLNKEFEQLKKHLKAEKNDTVIIACGEEKTVKKTMDIIAERINQLVKGVPEETRRTLENGDTEYLRPLPGSARLYPETDVPPVIVKKEIIEKLKKNLPEPIDVKIQKLTKKYGISEELAKKLVFKGYFRFFEKGVKTGVEPVLVARTLVIVPADLKTRENAKTENLAEKHFMEIFYGLREKKIIPDMIPEVLKLFCKNPKKSLKDILEKSKITTLTENELVSIITKTIQENQELLKKERSEKVLMGLVMAKVRGRAPGKVVMDVLIREIRKHKKV